MVQNARYPIKQLVPVSQQQTNNGLTMENTIAKLSQLTTTTSSSGAEAETTSGNESDLDQRILERQRAQLMARRGSQQMKRSIVGYVNMFELDFEAQMRSLDSAGHQTGYKYKRPLVRFYKKTLASGNN